MGSSVSRVWGRGEEGQSEDRGVTPWIGTLEGFAACLCACLSTWHLCGTGCSWFSWLFLQSDGIQRRSLAGRQLGSRGSRVQPEPCSREPESWEVDDMGSKSESSPLASSAESLLSFADPCLVVSLNISRALLS